MARLLLILAAIGLGAGYTGALHPAGDSLAVLRPVFIAATALFALFSGRRWAIAGLTLAALAAAPILWDMRPRPVPANALTIYQKNLLFALRAPEPLIADIRASGADLVLLQEVSKRNLAIPEALTDTHPHQLVCPAHSVGAVAILSRLPFAGDTQCGDVRGFAAVPVETPYGPISVAVLHLHWPWPYGQASHRDRILPLLSALPQPVIVAGDFNMVPRTHTLRQITAKTSTSRAGPPHVTLLLKRAYPLPIDHILAPAGWQAQTETRPKLGSDHRGLLARIAP